MSRLIAFGDSSTKGEGLKDVWDRRIQETRYHTDLLWSRKSWPQLLADRLNMTCVNLAQGGMGNREIAKHCWEFQFQPTDTVCILWTFSERMYIHAHSLARPLGPNKRRLREPGLRASISWAKKGKFKDLYKHWTTNPDRDLETVMYADLIYHWLTQRVAHTANFIYVPLLTSEFTMPEHTPLIEHDFLHMLDRAEDGGHPGPLTQQSWADQFYKVIKSRQ